MKKFPLLLSFLIAFALSACLMAASPLLVISVDGLEPKDVFESTNTSATVRNLRSLMKAGSYATVKGVLPTVTFPSHTTIVTGVSPSIHGISNNKTFDPFGDKKDKYFFYASQIKVPTLWDAVHDKGKITASFRWPVTAEATKIDFNIPDYFKSNDANDLSIVKAVSSPQIFELLEKRTGVSGEKIVSGDRMERDSTLTSYAAKLIELKRPYLTLVHLSGLDHAKHVFGPSSKEAMAALKRSDSLVGKLVKAARQSQPNLLVAIVSDHGFSPTQYDVNLLFPFIDAGLVKLDPLTKKVKSYRAFPWSMGASVAVVLENPNDEKTKQDVTALLTKLAADPQNGIAQFIDRKEIEIRGGPKEASFAVDFKLGYCMLDAETDGSFISASDAKGMHGYFPEHKEMRALFILAGGNLKTKRSLGDIDMRDIAPTFAKILEVQLPNASGKPLF